MNYRTNVPAVSRSLQRGVSTTLSVELTVDVFVTILFYSIFKVPSPGAVKNSRWYSRSRLQRLAVAVVKPTEQTRCVSRLWSIDESWKEPLLGQWKLRIRWAEESSDADVRGEEGRVNTPVLLLLLTVMYSIRYIHSFARHPSHTYGNLHSHASYLCQQVTWWNVVPKVYHFPS